MTTALIADDEPHMRALLREHLETFWPELIIVREAEDGPSALAAIESHRPDIAFLDIRMPGLTGLQVAYATQVPTRVVFVTAYDAYALEAFEANAMDYILKPVEPARLAKVVSKLKQALAAPGTPDVAQLAQALARLGVGAHGGTTAPCAAAPKLEWLQVAMGQQVRMVHVDDVLYFEADTKYTRVVAADFDGLIRITLKQLTEQLDATTFMQTHRSTVVNRRHIHAVHRRGEVMEIELKGKPDRLKVSLPNHHLFRAM